MKTLFAALCLSITFNPPFASTLTTPFAVSEISIGQSHSILNKKGDAYEVNIYLPRSYTKEPDRRYPVLYLIDGGKDQDFSHIAGLADLASVNPYTFRELIIVGVQTKNRLFELTSMNTDPRYKRPEGAIGGSDEFRYFLKSKVVPFTEETLRTNEKRIVMGESLAGLFIAETLLKTPELFTDYVSISPSMWYDDRHLSKSASELLNKHTTKARSLYVAMASEGGTMQKGLDELLDAIKTSRLKNLRVKYQDKSQSESHWSIYHGEALAALRWLLPAPAPEVIHEPAPWYLVEGGNPPNWKTEG